MVVFTASWNRMQGCIIQFAQPFRFYRPTLVLHSFSPLLLLLQPCVLLESPTEQRTLSGLQEPRVNSGQEPAKNFSLDTEGTELCQLPIVILKANSSLVVPQMTWKSTSAFVWTSVRHYLATKAV